MQINNKRPNGTVPLSPMPSALLSCLLLAQEIMPKASGDTLPGTFANNMSTPQTYWTPFAPSWRLPIRILGILSLSGVFPVLFSGNYREVIFPSLFGIYLLWTSCRTPTLRTLSRVDILLRRISIAFLTVIILGLLWAIFTSLSRP